MAHKDDLKAQAEKLGVKLEGTETVAELEAAIETASKDLPPDPTTKPKTEDTLSESEKMVPLSMVKQMIAEAMAQQAETNKPVKVKKVTEHHAHVWRLNGKWVVDFSDRNYDYENKKIIDPYIKEKIHAYNVFNTTKREFEAWIKIVFQDGSTEELPLNRYIERRTLVYCKITRREKVDKSYVIGEVEKKKEQGDRNVGTGIMIDQEVEMHSEIFHITTPDGESLVLPDYVIC